MNTYLLLAATYLPLLFSAGLPPPSTVPPHPAQTHPTPRSQPHRPAGAKMATTGARADSLDGIPGHHFGEPRSNFPELEARGYSNLDGYVSYSLRENRPEAPGWFGKHADQVRCTYWFRNDQFAGFAAVQRGPDGRRQLLAEEVTCLFGRGRLVSTGFGQATTRWEGRRVVVEYTDGHGEARLGINSQAVLAQVTAEKRAKQQADAAARAASLKTDNAPLSGH